MFLVLIVHADCACLGIPHPNNLESMSPRETWQLAVESFSIIGVNCFTLISGYFGISFSWRKIFSYLFQCLYFAVGIATVALYLWPERMTMTDWWNQWFILTRTDLWYVPAYFCLMLIAPILNMGIDRMKHTDFKWCVFLFLAFNLWCGWWNKGTFNPTGYTVIQLVLMYLIGRYFRKASWSPSSTLSRFMWIVVYTALTVGIFLTAIYLPDKAFAYNSPLVIGASVSFFLIFASFQFSSRVVNTLGASAFAVYLLHKAPVIWVMVVKPTVIRVWGHTDILTFSFFILVASIGVYLLSWVLDQPRRLISARIWGRG